MAKQALDKRQKNVYKFDIKELTSSQCGRSSVVERQLPKLNVEGSSPFARCPVITGALWCSSAQIVAISVTCESTTGLYPASSVLDGLCILARANARNSGMRAAPSADRATKGKCQLQGLPKAGRINPTDGWPIK